MTRKEYNPGDGEYGDSGESFMRQYIKSNGYTANKHPNGIYGEDVEYVSDVERFFAEVERCTASRWLGDEWFNWPTLNVLERRMVKPNTLFFTLSADMTKALVSFPNDLIRVKPEPKNNRHATGEMIREHEPLRCLKLDLTKPIEGSIAQMNAERVRRIVAESDNYSHVTRVLRGRTPFAFEAPYGIDDDEWREMLLDVEKRSGLLEYSNRGMADSFQKRLF